MQTVATKPRSSHNREAEVHRALVLIVDDDEGVRLSIRELVESVGLEAACFGSTKELLDSALYERPGCLVLDQLHRKPPRRNSRRKKIAS
jgi:hypothetical protein